MVQYYENEIEAPDNYKIRKQIRQRKLQDIYKENHGYSNARKNSIDLKKERARRKAELKANAKKIFGIAIVFFALFIISYRYALIDTSFKEKESLKKELGTIQKQNDQLKVSIQKQMNLSLIEQEAKEKIGMQKLDNNQKVYVNLEKNDFISSNSAESNENDNVANNDTENQNWWCKILKTIFNLK